jgi:dolichol-phosphate mannosyltransferase
VSSPPRTLVTVATYNEIENLPRLVDEIQALVPEVDLLVIDDNSPDGTGQWCDRRAAGDHRFHVLHRPGKLGLGTAIMAGMQYAIEQSYAWMLNMDSDFSHHPRYLPDLLATAWREGDSAADVVIGSRYIPQGGVEGWPWRRQFMSRAVNLYARTLLGLRPKDCSGGYRGYRTELLRQLDFSQIRSRGYSFQEEILWRLKRLGARIVERPIIFADRRQGQSKINAGEARSAVWIIFRLGLKNWLGI